MSSLRKAYIYVRDNLAGVLEETPEGFSFTYDEDYLAKHNNPVSLTLPLRSDAYFSTTLFSFFDGLIPEGWLLEKTVENWKLNPRDRFGLLLVACKDPVGAVSVRGEE